MQLYFQLEQAETSLTTLLYHCYFLLEILTQPLPTLTSAGSVVVQDQVLHSFSRVRAGSEGSHSHLDFLLPDGQGLTS